MRTVNSVTLLGNVVRAPEKRITSAGKSFVTFMIVTQRETLKYGEQVSESEFHNIVAWGGLSSVAVNFCKKGALVYIEGSLKTRTLHDEKGGKTFKVEIVSSNIISLKSPRKSHEEPYKKQIPADEDFFTATQDDFED